jgi:hypothetical protein
MSDDRTEWQETKKKAKTLNDGKAIKFPKDMKLGDALDKVESTQKAYSKAGDKEHNAAWAKAGDAYFKAAKDANLAAVTYQQALPNMEITAAARKALNAELSMNLLRNLGVVIAEGKRMEPQLAKVRKP